LINGETRKRWLFDSEEWGGGGEYSSYIEGIGMQTGLFGDFIQFEWWSSLSCVQLEDEHLWEDNSHGWGTCWGLVGEDKNSLNELHIYPNPASDLIRISGALHINITEMKLYNAMGQLVLLKEIQSDNAIIDVSAFERGMYFVLLESDQGIIREKLVIRRQYWQLPEIKMFLENMIVVHEKLLPLKQLLALQ